MNTQPLVSVVMPTYNRANMIAKAISSVLNQTYYNWELLIVDDASTDNTYEVVNDFVISDKRIKYFRFENNKGACAALNKGIDEAKGDYITFLDSDDEYFPEKVEKQLAVFGGNSDYNLGVVTCGRMDVTENGELLRTWEPSIEGLFLIPILKGEPIGAGTPFLMISNKVKTDGIRFDEKVMLGDFDFMIQISKKYSLAFTKYIGVKVLQHDGERLFNYERAVEDRLYLKQKHKDVFAKHKEVDSYYDARTFMFGILTNKDLTDLAIGPLQKLIASSNNFFKSRVSKKISVRIMKLVYHV